MGWLDSVRESRRMRAAHAANAKELEAKLVAQQREQYELKIAREREIAEYLTSIIISSESVESYAARHGGGIAIIDVPGSHKSVEIKELKYYGLSPSGNLTVLPSAERTVTLGDVNYLKNQGMFAIFGAQRRQDSGINYIEATYYGLPVRRVQDGDNRKGSVDSGESIEVR